MNRRRFVRTVGAAALATLGLPVVTHGRSEDDGVRGPARKKTASLAHFEGMKIGVSFHFGMNTFTGNDYDEGTAAAKVYAPGELNVDQWLATAALIGAKYAILTAKHMSGFCLWEADDYDYDVAASGNHTDVVAAFMAACQKRNITPGIYYCVLDPRNEGNQGHVDGAGRVSLSYYRLIVRQIAELHRKYKGIGLQVIDIPGKLAPEERWEIYRTVKSLSPNCLMMLNQTWDISQANQGRICAPEAWPTDIIVSEDALPPKEGHDPWVVYEGKRYYMPMASWFASGPFYEDNKYRTWFWNEHFKTRPADELFDLCQKTVSRQASFIVNLSPDKRGLLADEQVKEMHRLAALLGGAI
jgi:alpha-L-fucosidase